MSSRAKFLGLFIKFRKGVVVPSEYFRCSPKVLSC